MYLAIATQDIFSQPQLVGHLSKVPQIIRLDTSPIQVIVLGFWLTDRAIQISLVHGELQNLTSAQNALILAG